MNSARVPRWKTESGQPGWALLTEIHLAETRVSNTPPVRDGILEDCSSHSNDFGVAILTLRAGEPIGHRANIVVNSAQSQPCFHYVVTRRHCNQLFAHIGSIGVPVGHDTFGAPPVFTGHHRNVKRD